MCRTHLKNDNFCAKNITFPKHMMTNHIFEHPNIYFDAMFLYVDNTFLIILLLKALHAHSSIYNRNKYTQWNQVPRPELATYNPLLK